jgi:hypothetical protein
MCIRDRRWQEGVEQAELFVNTDVNLTAEQKEFLQTALAALSNQANFLEQLYEMIAKPGQPKAQQAGILRVIKLLDTIFKQINLLRQERAEEAVIWSAMIQSEQFLELLSIPQISSVVYHTYDAEMQTREDPRLVQLALLKICSDRENIEQLREINNEARLYKEIGKQVRRQLTTLELEIAAMPEF